MPRSPREASIRGPTPGSSVTGRERRSVRVVRAGSTAPPSLKVGNAIGTKAYVGPNDPADLSDELLLDPESFGQLREELGGGDVSEVERPSGFDGGPDLLDNGRHLPLAPAGALEGDYLPSGHLQYRPDIQGGAEQALRTPDAPALGQILERADGEEHIRPRYGSLSGASNLIEVPTIVDTAQRLEQDQTRPHLGAPGVEHVNWAVHHPRRLQGGVVGAAELAREGQHQDIFVGGERFVGLDECARGGLRRRRKDVGVA